MIPISKTALSNNRALSVSTFIPEKQLKHASLQIGVERAKFDRWSAQNHFDSYSCMRRIIQVWKECNIDQYLIYGKIDASSPFTWEIVPYKKCHTWFERAAQQIQVLWRTVFGGTTFSQENKRSQLELYTSSLTRLRDVAPPSDIECQSIDAFCNDDVISRQSVLIGRKVQALFNYAPIGFGGERLHFLVVPKEHRATFTDMTADEYSESMELTKKIVDYFMQTRRTIQNVYLLNKTGVDAGQSVPHCHTHIIFTTSTNQDFWGKITIFKKIILGSSPMKPDVLEKKVQQLRDELATL